MTDISSQYCTVVRGFLDETTVESVASYMKNKSNSNQWIVRGKNFCYDMEPSQYSSYADPLAEVVLQSVTPQIEEVTQLKVFPTYSFSRIYVKGDELTPHVDRPSCEISATVNLANVGGIWPIWMKAPGMPTMKIELNPGDAVIYKGCEVLHWRDKMIDQESTVQFMLHYVDQNGPYSNYKWDQRPGLGFPDTSRSQ